MVFIVSQFVKARYYRTISLVWYI